MKRGRMKGSVEDIGAAGRDVLEGASGLAELRARFLRCIRSGDPIGAVDARASIAEAFAVFMEELDWAGVEAVRSPVAYDAWLAEDAVDGSIRRLSSGIGVEEARVRVNRR